MWKVAVWSQTNVAAPVLTLRYWYWKLSCCTVTFSKILTGEHLEINKFLRTEVSATAAEEKKLHAYSFNDKTNFNVALWNEYFISFSF